MNIVNQGSAGVGGICCMNLSPGQSPEKKTVYCSESELSGICRITRSCHIIEQPGDFGAGKIGVQ